jgi:hypothetical protein
MRQLVITLVILSALWGEAKAQALTGSIRGTVKLAQGDPVGAANVFLVAAKDSALLRTVITTKEGQYAFEKLAAGSYIVKATHTGYAPAFTTSLSLSDSLLIADLIVQPVSTAMNTVTVTARRPLIEQQFDKLIFNVNGNITAAGNTALEVLAKAPGVMVDAEGTISLGGRTGVLVLIDGRRTHLSGNDLAAYLRGLPASAIDRIDLITNPSAQYEAEGTSGIIDIRLRKDNKAGYNGTVSAAYLLGTHSSGNGSLNFNYRKGSLNVYGTLSKTYDHIEARQETDRLYFENQTEAAGSMYTFNDRKFQFNSNNIRIGADYYAGKKTVIGVVGMGVLNRMEADYITRTENFYPVDPMQYSIDRSLNANRRSNKAFNFNIKRTIDSIGREWNFDVDVATYANNDDINLQANFYNKEGVINRPFYHLTGDLDGGLNVYAARLDYQRPKTWGGTMQAGVRSSLVKADNQLLFFDRSTGTPVLDAGRSNTFLYEEYINAGYVNYQQRLKKLSIQAGLRAEQTNGKGKQVTTGGTFDRSYLQLFPNLYAGYDLTKNYTTALSISRRINRPGYSQLNPFRFYASPFGYTEGNPYLLPQLTFMTEWSNTFYKRYIVRLSYSETQDLISLVWGTDAVDKRIGAQRPVNLEKGQFYRLTLTAPVTIKNWFTSFNNIIGAYNRYKGEAFNTPLERSLPYVYVSSNNTFRFHKTWTAELNAWYQSPFLSGGYQRVQGISAVSLGLGKRVMGEKGNLRLNVSDLFQTNLGHGVTRLDNYELYVRQWNETRRVTLSFSYNFGKSNVKAARTRTLSAEEERSRAN